MIGEISGPSLVEGAGSAVNLSIGSVSRDDKTRPVDQVLLRLDGLQDRDLVDTGGGVLYEFVA